MRTRVIVQDEPCGPLRIDDARLPDPGRNEVVVGLRSSGVCHSQLATMSWPREAPLLFGHEGFGYVLGGGPAALRRLPEGTPVAVSWVPRPVDRPLVRGRAILSDGRTAVAPNAFTWAEHCLVDEAYVTPLPATLASPESAVLGCAVLTGMGTVCDVAPVAGGATVAVYGTGGIGLCAVAGARMRGAARIVAVDRHAAKLKLAGEFGATDVVDATREDPAEAIARLTGSAGADLVVDCVGTGETLRQALRSARRGRLGVRRGGTVALVGLPPGDLTIDAEDLLRGEKTLVGSCGCSCAQEDIVRYGAYCRDGHLDLRSLVTDRFPIDRAAEAVRSLDEGRVTGRALLTMNDGKWD